VACKLSRELWPATMRFIIKAVRKKKGLPLRSPYREDLVAFDNPAAAGVRLAGTLTLPQGAGPFPAAVFISGSGPNGRDEEQAGHKLALVLADALTRDGCAVLRYDKRGVAKSTGDYAAATTLDFASDATAAVAYLRGRSDIVRAKVGLIGHSEGGTTAALGCTAHVLTRFTGRRAGSTETSDLCLL
jgi:pimeloyl-ACP methyl ester carboxylesterase